MEEQQYYMLEYENDRYGIGRSYKEADFPCVNTRVPYIKCVWTRMVENCSNCSIFPEKRRFACGMRISGWNMYLSMPE